MPRSESALPGPHGFERTVTFAIDDDPAVIGSACGRRWRGRDGTFGSEPANVRLRCMAVQLHTYCQGKQKCAPTDYFLCLRLGCYLHRAAATLTGRGLLHGKSGKMRTGHLKRSSAMRRKQDRTCVRRVRKSVKAGMKRSGATTPGPRGSAAPKHNAVNQLSRFSILRRSGGGVPPPPLLSSRWWPPRPCPTPPARPATISRMSADGL